MVSPTPQEIASRAARSLEFDDGGRVIGPAQSWRRRDRFNLLGDVDCEFPDLPGTHRILVTAHFDTDGSLLSLVARDPLFGDPIGRAGQLPSEQATSTPDASHYEAMGLWLDEATGLVWVPGIWGQGKYTFDSAQRLPDRLAEGDGYKGFYDWRIPSVTDFDRLSRCAHAEGLLHENRPLEGVGRFIDETKGAPLVWTCELGQEPDEQGSAYEFSRTGHEPRSVVPWFRSGRLPIMLVRDALEHD